MIFDVLLKDGNNFIKVVNFFFCFILFINFRLFYTSNALKCEIKADVLKQKCHPKTSKILIVYLHENWEVDQFSDIEL